MSKLFFNFSQILALTREFDLEANWILEKLKSNYDSHHNVKKKIILLLEFNKKDFLDVPLIVDYRESYYKPELSKQDVWKIFDLDREWMKLIEYK